MARFLLLVLLGLFLARALRRLIQGIVEGVSLGPGAGQPDRGVAMARDPMCGTFVVPSRALTVIDRGRVQYFCSEQCRERYRRGSPAAMARSSPGR